MAWYENCPPDVELVSVATLDSIFEMEQFIPRLDESEIPWRVVEHDSTLLRDPAVQMGYATLYVAVGYEEKALALLKEHRLQQAAGRPCPSCGLWLGPNIIKCPACGFDLKTAAEEKIKAKAERSGEHESEFDDESDEFDEFDDLESVEDRLAALEDDYFDLSELVHDLLDRIEVMTERIEKLEGLLADKDAAGENPDKDEE